MTIEKLKYVPFSLKLKAPFQSSSKIITERNGFILSVTDELKNISFGECSPLPGFSGESLIDAERILKGLQYQLNGFILEENLDSVSDLLAEFQLVPSLQFAIEQAVINLLCTRDKNFLKDFFQNTKPGFNVNAVIGLGKKENILDDIDKKIRKGYKTFKIKIGRDDFNQDIGLIEKVRDVFGDKIMIRLDANQKWNFENAISFINQLSEYDIEYIEEPCNSLNYNLNIANVSKIPIALDESIRSIDEASQIINESKIHFLIFKPMINTGIISSLHLIKEAQRKDKKIIISSSFESAVGKSALVLLASATNHTYAHGLATSEYYERNICSDKFEVNNGKIFFEQSSFPPLFDLSIL